MKILHHINRSLPVWLVTLHIVTLPLSSWRVPLAGTSLSLASLLAMTLCVVLAVRARRVALLPHTNRTLWLLALCYICAFLPSLILHPSVHALGVVAEWIILPIAVALCVTQYTASIPQMRAAITASLLLLLIILVADAIIAALFGTITYDHRLHGHFYTSPNHLAMMIAPLLFIPLTVLRAHPRYTHPMFAVIALACGVLLGTQSLSVLLAMTVTTILWYMTRNHTSRTIVLVAILGIILSAVFVGIKSVNGPPLHTHSSLTSRIMIWDTATMLIRRTPLFGHAIDSFQDAYLAAQPLFPPYQDWAVPTPHNLFLTLLFSGGIAALTTFLLLYAYVLHIGIQHRTHPVVQILIFAILTPLFIGCTDTPVWKIDLSHLWWIITTLFLLYLPHKKHAS